MIWFESQVTIHRIRKQPQYTHEGQAMIGLISQGAGYGFTAGTMPGPFLSYLINTTLNQGWRKSIIVIFAPILSDGPIIVLMTFLLSELPNQVQQAIQIVGGLFVLYLAWGAWRQFQARVQIGTSETTSTNSRTLAQAVAMNMLNPNPYIFWGSVTGPLLIKGLEQSIWHGLAFLAAFYGVFMVILVVWVMIFDRARHIDERMTRGILLVTIVVLGLLGASLIGQGLGLRG
jgi:threonine/homoserine/homoserine lactone efflux protein